jgi:hypothetical protein
MVNSDLELVSSYDEILVNAKNFQNVWEHPDSAAYGSISFFSDWYYLEEEGGIFAPNKFIGYKDTKIENYHLIRKKGHGSNTKKVLDEFFEKSNGERRDDLYDKLVKLVRKKSNKELSRKIETKGGIYIKKTN